MAPRSPRPRNAFTLLELVVVVMFLGILAGVAAPRYREALTHAHLRARAVQLATDLKRARSEALSESTSHTINFSDVNAIYWSADLQSLDRPEEKLQVNLAKGDYPIDLRTINFGGAESVTFDWYGAPSASGSLALTADDSGYVVAVDEAGNVTVSQL